LLVFLCFFFGFFFVGWACENVEQRELRMNGGDDGTVSIGFIASEKVNMSELSEVANER
jgi:hypothetical protein